ncbi:MAG: hypothetical protein R3Y13_05735 [bacterium]
MSVKLRNNKEECFRKKFQTQHSVKSLLNTVKDGVDRQNKPAVANNIQPIIRSMCEVFASGTYNLNGDFSNMKSSLKKVLSALNETYLVTKLSELNIVSNDVKHQGGEKSSMTIKDIISCYNELIVVLNRGGSTNFFNNYSIKSNQNNTNNKPKQIQKQTIQNPPQVKKDKVKGILLAKNNARYSHKITTPYINYFIDFTDINIEKHKTLFGGYKINFVSDVNFSCHYNADNVETVQQFFIINIDGYEKKYNVISLLALEKPYENGMHIKIPLDNVAKNFSIYFEVTIKRKTGIISTERPIFHDKVTLKFS